MRTLVVALASVACASPQRATLDLRRDAAAALASCDDDTVHDAAARHGVQLALAPCGHNRITQGVWSPDGRLLMLRFGASAVVMDPRTRRLPRLVLPPLLGDAVWTSARRIAVAVQGTAPGAPRRIAEVDIGDDGVASAVYFEDAPWSDGDLGLVGRLSDGRWWGLYGPEGDDEATASGWAWRRGEAPSPWPQPGQLFSAALGPSGEDALFVDAEGLTLFDVSTAQPLRRWTGPTAASLDPSGRWILATVPGETTMGQSRVVRPDLWLLDRQGEARWRLDDLHGDQPAWYPGAAGWITWRMWGLADTPLRRNVALLDAGDRLAGLASGGDVWGVTASP